MFRTVQPRIGAWAQESPDNLAHVMEFVLLTIQQPIESIPMAQASVRRQGKRSRFLFGPKRDGWEYVKAHKREIFADLQELDTLGKLVYLANIPGFGLPKAGFVMQLVYGEVGCLDTHNLNRFGIKGRKRLQIKGNTKSTQLRKAKEYVSLCKRLGGTEYLWNSWCEYVADKRPYVGSAEKVSRLHLNAIKGGKV